MPHKSFLTSSLSNFQKQFNRSTIMAFTLSMLLLSPTTLNLRILMTLFQLQSPIFSQIWCTVSRLYSLDYSFCICPISCICCIAKRFMTNLNPSSPPPLQCTFPQYPWHLPHMCTINQTAWVWLTYCCIKILSKSKPLKEGKKYQLTLSAQFGNPAP